MFCVSLVSFALVRLKSRGVQIAGVWVAFWEPF